MINLFPLAANDQSVFYLGQIFGYVGNVLPAQNPNLLVGIMFKVLNTTALTIGALLVVYVTVVGLLKTAQEGEFLGRQWNSLWVPIRTVLGIAALFPTATGYSAIQVVIMWIALQGVGAADTLWNKVLAFISVTGSPYTSVNSSSLQTTAIQPAMQNLFSSLVCQASAKATYSDVSTENSGGSTPVQYFCNHNPNDTFCTMLDSEMLNPIEGKQVSGTTYNMGPLGKCGQLTYCDAKAACKAPDSTASGTASKASSTTGPDTPGCLACKAQQSALQTIVPALGAVASKLVEIDNQYVQFYELPVESTVTLPTWIQTYCSDNQISPEKCCQVDPPSPPSAMALFSGADKKSSGICAKNFPADNDGSSYANTSSSAKPPMNAAKSATDFYLQYPLGAYLNGSDFINAAVGEYAAALVGAVSTNIQNQMDNADLSGWLKEAQDTGWILAGGYYYAIAGMNQQNQDALYPTLTVTTAIDPSMKSYRNNFNAVGDLITMMVTKNANSANFGNTPGAAGVSSALDAGGAALLESWQNSLSSNSHASGSNPLTSMATFGYQMMITAQLLFFVIAAVVAIATALATINPMVLGTGITLNPAGEAVKAITSFLGPFFVVLIGALYSIGAILGIYVPLIPYMIFTVGAIGWLIAVVEAMVAGPIIALGILSPGGQHDILGRAEPAMMQLFNLFLRPSLMVLGMMIAMLLSSVAVSLVNAGFYTVTQQIIGHPGLFEQILFIAAYTSFIVTVMNKVFSLIYIIPERILTWIGGPAVQYGEQEALHATKQAVEGAAGAATGAAKESGGSVYGGVMATRQSNEIASKANTGSIPVLNAGGGSSKKETGGGGGAGG